MMPEPGVDWPGSMERRELPVDKERGQQNTEDAPKAGTPWGFFLVLAAIVVVAIMYSVTIFFIDQKDPEVVFGAMAASFTVIGTLVGTYFGIKAGLDGQDKAKETLSKAVGSPGERPQLSIEENGDRRKRGQPAEELKGGTREHGWDGEGV